MPLHPELTAFLELVDASLCTGKRRLLHELSPAEARDEYDSASAALDLPPIALSNVQSLVIPVRDGTTLRARLYSCRISDPLPTTRGSQYMSLADQPVLLFFHGGGFVVGSLDSHDSLCRSLASRTPCAVLSLEYRLAPEHCFPTAFNDGMDALAWLHRNGARHGLDPNRIAVGGDSAGGTLAAAVSLATRNHSQLAGARPVLQLLMYPSLAGRQTTASQKLFAEGYLLEAATIRWFFNHYLNSAADGSDWRFAPLLADVAGTVPAHLVLAEFDPLVEEGMAYARKLQAADVPADVTCYPGMLHDFMRLGSIIPAEVQQAHADAAAALARAFQGKA